MSQSRRIIFTCGREPSYTRNDVLLRALRPRCSLIEVTDDSLGSLIAHLLRLTPRLGFALCRLHGLGVVGFVTAPSQTMIRLI